MPNCHSTLRDSCKAYRDKAKAGQVLRLNLGQVYSIVEQSIRNDPTLPQQTKDAYLKSWARAPDTYDHLTPSYVEQSVQAHQGKYAKLQVTFEKNDKGKLTDMHPILAP